MKLYIVRHGEPNYEADCLTEKGKREAEALAKRLEKLHIDDFYVSPLGRARETAEYTLELLGRKAETVPWLEEFRGRVIDPKTGKKSIAWDFMPQYWTRCPELWDRTNWRDNALVATGNAAEIYDETARGLDALLARYGYARRGDIYVTDGNSDRTVCLVCHFGIAMVMLSHLLCIPPYLLLHGFIMPPSSVTSLVTEERIPGQVWFRCTALGDTSHLYAANEPISHHGCFREHYGVDDGLNANP